MISAAHPIRSIPIALAGKFCCIPASIALGRYFQQWRATLVSIVILFRVSQLLCHPLYHFVERRFLERLVEVLLVPRLSIMTFATAAVLHLSPPTKSPVLALYPIILMGYVLNHSSFKMFLVFVHCVNSLPLFLALAFQSTIARQSCQFQRQYQYRNHCPLPNQFRHPYQHHRHANFVGHVMVKVQIVWALQ
jgi:hypothetical protein